MIGRTAVLALVPLIQLLLFVVTTNAQIHDDASPPTSIKRCTRQLDLSLVVDESASITRGQWHTLIPFLNKVIESLDLDNSDIRLSLTTFSTPVRSLFTFLDKASHDSVTALLKVNRMRDTKPPFGMTYTGQALTYVRNFVLPFGRKNAPKAVLLITDGDSSDPDVTSQTAAMLRDEGVTLLVVGVGKVNTSECRGIVGCDAKMDCPLFVHTEWEEMIDMVNRLMADVCETIAEDAVCEPQWSEWSACNAGCGLPGTRTRNLLYMETKRAPTVGSNGQQGRACTEQIDDFPSPAEPCYGPCAEAPKNDTPAANIGGGDADYGHDEDAEDDDSPTTPHHENVPANDAPVNPSEEPSKPINPSDESKRPANPSEEPSKPINPSDESKRPANPSEEPSKPVNPSEESYDSDDDDSTGYDSDESGGVDYPDSDDEEDEPMVASPEVPIDVVTTARSGSPENADSLTKSEVPKSAQTLPHPAALTNNTPKAESHTPSPSTDGSRLRENTAETPTPEEATTKASSGYGGKIAGGVIAGLILLGAGGAYAAYKNKKSTSATGDDGYTGADESAKPMTDAETYEVTEFDNNIWGEAT